MNSISNSFSGLFWFPKVPRAAGTSVIPERACQEKRVKKFSLGPEQDHGESTDLPVKPHLQGFPDEGLEWQNPTEKGQCQEAAEHPRVSAQAEASCIVDQQDHDLGERKPVRAAELGLALKRPLEHVSWDASTHDLLGFTALNTLNTPPTLHKLQN